ncbi:TetR/AcrR family transcriptional regulator [Leuconostoc palmae]|uniref:TetR/AcrR family transcriptional regulator n=1 Tax=Leuconostoc palmae TaxID=501487 RepID=UPI001C7CFE4C|nr:TetR/AcrR family transcriptional regulator [Leuconostoc palmae]
MSRKEDARVIRTKKRIEDTTIALLTIQPDFSITTLLERAAVTKGTFYKYFQNKEHLISEVNNSLLFEISTAIQDKIHISKIIRIISGQAAFYNAVLNFNTDVLFLVNVKARMRSFMKTKVDLIEDESIQQKIIFQFEALMGGFWSLVAVWLDNNMDIDQGMLISQFEEILRLNTTGISKNALSLFDFSNDVK